MDSDQEHMRIVDSFLIQNLDIPSSSLSYDLATVLSNSTSSFTCDLAVAIESIPNMEPFEPMISEIGAPSARQRVRTM